MHRTTKIATCSYCGTRAALILAGRERHELACSACGAPLHELKALPTEAVSEARRPATGRDPAAGADVRAGARRQPQRPRTKREDGDAPRRRKDGRRPKAASKSRPRKGPLRRLFDEAIDAIEDLFD